MILKVSHVAAGGGKGRKFNCHTQNQPALKVKYRTEFNLLRQAAARRSTPTLAENEEPLSPRSAIPFASRFPLLLDCRKEVPFASRLP